MERRTALALATAVAGTVMAASAAFAVNVGLLQHDNSQPVGVLETSAIDPGAVVDPKVVTVVVEDPAPAATSSDTSAADASTANPTSISGATDDGNEIDDSDEPSHEAEEEDEHTGTTREPDDDD